MFKLKPGNVFQKINSMDRKQAYTWGAIVVVCFVALITLASFMGNADDTSFDGLDTRGYDLADMPFATDEAEQYLLANVYPDMQNNNATVLFSAEEKAARQAEDVANESESSAQEEEEDSSARSDRETRSSQREGDYSSSRRYGGRERREPTQIGQLGSAAMSHSGGGGISGTFGAPRGDFSPYKSQDKGNETPAQLKEQNARQSLGQFAKASLAAAKLKDSKGANAKRALMGGDVRGSEAFGKNGVDMEKLGGLALDTNAPTMSSDFDNLADDVAQAAKEAEENNDDEESLTDKLLEQLWTGLLDIGLTAVGNVVDKGIDSMFNNSAGNSAGREYAANCISSCTGECAGSCDVVARQLDGQVINGQEFSYDDWSKSDDKSLTNYISPRRAGRYMRKDGDPGYMAKWHEGYNNSRENSLNVGANNNNSNNNTNTNDRVWKVCNTCLDACLSIQDFDKKSSCQSSCLASCGS